jgi:hypothetical protein
MIKPPKRRGKANAHVVERVRAIRIRNTDYCDDKVPVSIYSKKADAELHRQSPIRQQEPESVAFALLITQNY